VANKYDEMDIDSKNLKIPKNVSFVNVVVNTSEEKSKYKELASR
jgi:hypothetical protein